MSVELLWAVTNAMLDHEATDLPHTWNTCMWAKGAAWGWRVQGRERDSEAHIGICRIMQVWESMGYLPILFISEAQKHKISFRNELCTPKELFEKYLG